MCLCPLFGTGLKKQKFYWTCIANNLKKKKQLKWLGTGKKKNTFYWSLFSQPLEFVWCFFYFWDFIEKMILWNYNFYILSSLVPKKLNFPYRCQIFRLTMLVPNSPFSCVSAKMSVCLLGDKLSGAKLYGAQLSYNSANISIESEGRKISIFSSKSEGDDNLIIWWP